MFCSNCGASMPDGQAFCTNCGTRLTNPQPVQAAQPVQPVQPVQPEAPKPPKAPKPKKRLLGWIIAGVAAVAVIAGVVLGWGYIRNFAERTFSSPENYYQKVEKRAISSATDTQDNTAGLADKMFSADSKNAVQGSVTVSVGKTVTDLLTGTLGEDMSWLKNAGVTFTVDRTQKDLLGAKATVQLNGTDLVNLDGVYDKSSHMGYFCLPEFSKEYIGVDVEDLLEDYAWENGYDSTYQFLSTLLYDDGSMLSAIPDAETINRIIERYSNIIIKDLDDVERDTEKVTAADVTCSYTALTVEIDKNDLEKIAKDVVNTAADDRDIKDLVMNIAAAMGENGDALYQQLREEMLDADLTIDEDVKIVMVVYVNNAGDVKGRDIKIKISGQEIASIRYINAEKGTKFGTEILIETPEVTISATGNGTNKNDYIKGTLDVQVSAAGETHTLGTVEIDGDTKNNDFVGEITFTPSEELLEMALRELDLPSYLEDMVRNAKLSFINHSTKDHLDMSIAIKSGSSELVTLRMECKETSPLKLSAPSDYLSPDQWASSLDQASLMGLISNLQKAGVPMSFLGNLF